MHEKRFSGDITRLRRPDRVERLQVEHVVNLCLENGDFRNVLDVGTGTGLFAEAFSRQGLKISGLDVNPDMLAAAQRFIPDGDFREGTLESLPFDNDSFDLVFMGVVLHESDDVPKALKEALRVTRQRVAILEWPYKETESGPPLAHRLDPEDLFTKFSEAGFSSWEMTNLDHTILYRLEKPGAKA